MHLLSISVVGDARIQAGCVSARLRCGARLLATDIENTGRIIAQNGNPVDSAGRVRRLRVCHAVHFENASERHWRHVPEEARGRHQLSELP